MSPNHADRVLAVEEVAREVVRAHARDVDARARFPSEALAALRQVGALRAAVPADLGGWGADVLELVRSCSVVAEHCASTAMVLAMHHIQVLSIAQHRGEVPELATYLGAVAAEQRLIASVTSEVGPSGNMRRSVCAPEPKGSGFELTKQATTLSYGEYADDLLITARRSADAAPSDQVLVLALRGGHTLSDIGVWDTMGLRGTCSPGSTVRATGQAWQILPEPFGTIASVTMTPVSHILWAGCWLGLARDALATARAKVRSGARGDPGVVPPVARHLAEAGMKLQLLENEVLSVARDYSEHVASKRLDLITGVAFALRVNNLKVNASRLVVEIVSEALGICGIEGYKNNSRWSLARHLRDAHSAALMIHNDRILETNASLLLVYKGA